MDYEKIEKKIRSKDIKDVKRRRLLGFLELPKGDTAEDLKHRIERVALGKTPLKAARTSSVTVLDAKEVERKQMEEENEIWEKNIVRKAVSMAAKWTGKMENGKDTTLEEDFVVMAFGDVFVKELKMSPGGWVDVPVGDYKPSHLHEHPNLKVIGAPRVNFNQSNGKDLCVSKSLALTLYSIGFTKEAVEVDLQDTDANVARPVLRVCGLTCSFAVVFENAESILSQRREYMVSMMTEYDRRCAACSSYATPCCLFWARRPGFFGNRKKQGLWPLGAVVHRRAKAFNVIHNVQEFGEFRKFPSSGFDSWNVGFAHLHLFKN